MEARGRIPFGPQALTCSLLALSANCHLMARGGPAETGNISVHAILVASNCSTRPLYRKLTRLLIHAPLLLPKHTSSVNSGKNFPLGQQLYYYNDLPLISRFQQTKNISFTSNSGDNSPFLANRGTKTIFLGIWQSFVHKWAVDPIHSPVNNVLQLYFLQELYERGSCYISVNTGRSTLSSFTLLEENLTVGNHPLVQLTFPKRGFSHQASIPSLYMNLRQFSCPSLP